MEETFWEGQNFSEVVAPQEEEEEKEEIKNANEGVNYTFLRMRIKILFE
jgi:hypothetical protein